MRVRFPVSQISMQANGLFVSTVMTYSEKLRDRRWQALAARVKEKANWKCEDPDCKSPPESNLQVHHVVYVSGFEPWDYDESMLIALCQHCHEYRQTLDNECRIMLGKALRNVPSRRLLKFTWSLIEAANKESLQ